MLVCTCPLTCTASLISSTFLLGFLTLTQIDLTVYKNTLSEWSNTGKAWEWNYLHVLCIQPSPSSVRDTVKFIGMRSTHTYAHTYTHTHTHAHAQHINVHVLRLPLSTCSRYMETNQWWWSWLSETFAKGWEQEPTMSTPARIHSRAPWLLHEWRFSGDLTRCCTTVWALTCLPWGEAGKAFLSGREPHALAHQRWLTRLVCDCLQEKDAFVQNLECEFYISADSIKSAL